MNLLIPSAGTPVSFLDIFTGLASSFNRSIPAFESIVKSYTNKKYCYFTNSGTTAFYVILKALRRISKKTEVVLPAYTAPSLILPIKKAELKPVLCDISLKTFNMDIQSMNKCINENTLCIVPVHMFGLPIDMESIVTISQQPLFVVENAASSLGTTIDNRPTGVFGDVGFYSFNRGKNLSTLSGGCIVTDNGEIAEAIQREWLSLPRSGFASQLKIAARLIALALAVRPLFYTVFNDLISKFKYTALHTDFDSFSYTKFQAGIGCALFGHASKIFNKRYDHGMFLFDMLKGLKGISLPELLPHTVPVFNQFPILFDDETIKETCFKKINDTGIESTKLYPDPIHRVYDLGYDLNNDPFPNATYFSRRLLLIPTHPIIDIEKLSIIINIIRGSLGL
ncbi:MAG: DegT/DnrJ/EryC1/StrS family aminotransferase [Planctomycetota bacterium]|nr:DegT/DnrJ/EryC1/StrS family aminotransferase [Planctomycetota bacterium]MDE1889749.1 DegT/DnrJ/EryC1/StrS family aminotransferase [Planctomycetota bacterium]MDE2217274.1 DegT/DnrJ/EryC1/StrS family aminotransferase [Planctomycetota bacterium]